MKWIKQLTGAPAPTFTQGSLASLLRFPKLGGNPQGLPPHGPQKTALEGHSQAQQLLRAVE